MKIFAHVNTGTIWHACQLKPNGAWTDFTPVTDANCATPDRGAPDINRDSKPDLVGVHTDSGQLQSFYSLGSGGYAFGPNFGPGWGDYHNLTHAGDINGDGKSDLVALRQSNGHLQSFYSLGSGGYAFGPDFGTALANHYSLCDAGDLNGDGRRDLVAIRGSDGRLQSFYSNGTGGYIHGPDFGPGWNAYSELTNPGDINGDGRLDLIAIMASTGRLQSFHSLGTGGYAFGPDFGPGWWAYRSFKNAGDLNGDGRADIVSVRNSDGRLQSFYSAGTGGYLFGPDFGPGWGDYDELV